MQPIFLATIELAAYLAAHYPRPYNKRTLDNWRHPGRGPAFCKQAGRVLYKLEDVQAWERRRAARRRYEMNQSITDELMSKFAPA